MTNSRDAAVELAKRGFRVFRVDNQRSTPSKKGWTETASKDPETVFKEFSDGVGESVIDNPAILTGGPLVVFDFDVKKNRPGLVSLAELAAEGLPLETLTTRTASGGLHLYFQANTEDEYRNRQGWREGVDVRGHHGFVVGPGAVREGVGSYGIVKDLPLATLPDWLKAELASTRGAARKELESVENKWEDDWSIGETIRHLEASAPADGERHKTLIAAIHKGFDHGVTAMTMLALIPEHWPAFVHYTQDLENEIGSVVEGRKRDGKQWGVEHPRRRPSAYLTFERIDMTDANRPREDAGLESRSFAELAGKDPPAREWLVPDFIPDRTVTLFMGDGGVGKSLLALQLCAAAPLRSTFLGMEVTPGPVLYASAEDEMDELHRRMVDIARAEGFGLEDLTDFHVVPLAGLDAVLGESDGKGGIRPTKLWRAFERRVATLKPKLVVLDTLADVYAGEENVRAQVRQFVGMVRGLAIKNDLAAMLIGHPSLSGLASGSGTSGSTGWSNSVRSRLYLRRPKEDDPGTRDPNLRILQTMKQNYGPGVGDERMIRWEAGRFRLCDPRVAVESDVDEMFLSLLTKFVAEGRVVTDKKGVSYAPSLFAKREKLFTKEAYAAAMERLFEAKKIVLEEYGSQSKIRKRLALVKTDS